MNMSTTYVCLRYLPPHTHGTRRDAAPWRRCPSAAKKPVAKKPVAKRPVVRRPRLWHAVETCALTELHRAWQSVGEPNIVQKLFAMSLIGGAKGVELPDSYNLL